MESNCNCFKKNYLAKSTNKVKVKSEQFLFSNIPCSSLFFLFSFFFFLFVAEKSLKEEKIELGIELFNEILQLF